MGAYLIKDLINYVFRRGHMIEHLFSTEKITTIGKNACVGVSPNSQSIMIGFDFVS